MGEGGAQGGIVPEGQAAFAALPVLGLPDAEGRVVLLAPERNVPLGARVY